jgi:hypothetical protein
MAQRSTGRTLYSGPAWTVLKSREHLLSALFFPLMITTEIGRPKADASSPSLVSYKDNPRPSGSDARNQPGRCKEDDEQARSRP